MPDLLQSPKRPTSLNELAAAVRTAAEQNHRIKMTGSAAMDLTQFPPESRPFQPISTARLNKVTEHAIGDMTVIVEAGISLEVLQRTLAWQNQWLPVDPPVFGPNRTPGQRTIGGLIASNSLGPLQFGCGDWRLFILGMRWVDAAGRIIKGGGRTMKNVAGYSSPRLMIGSCGSLGVIGEITLRTFARPADEQSALFYCRDAGQVEDLIAQIMLSPTTPAYVQIIGGRTFASNPLQLPAGRQEASAPAGQIVVAGFLGRPEICAAQIQIVRTLPAASQLESISQTAAQSGRLRLWMTTEPALANVSDDSTFRFRLHARSSQIAAILEALENLASNGIWAIGEALGRVRGVIAGEMAIDTLQKLAHAHQTALTITQGLPQTNPLHALTQRIKHELDPYHIFGNSPR